MANGVTDNTVFGPDLSLSLDQQSLLRTALSSNNPTSSPTRNSIGLQASPSGSGADSLNAKASPAPQFTTTHGNSLYQSPIQAVSGSGIGNLSADDSPFLDGYELEDGNFDWEGNGEQLFGDLPGGNEDDLHDKRKASGEGDEVDGKNKRHEGNEKNNKKPGRKPLNSSEPTTKRKAQNRAAQRAFRERKERHVKDLQTRVDDLEKASESTNHENGRLRATVERLNNELKEYRKRFSMTSTGHSPPPATAPRSNYSSSEFSFAFPKFGDLPGSTFMSNGSLTRMSTSNGVKPPSRTPSGNIASVTRTGSSGSVTNARSPSATVQSPVNQNGSTSFGSTPVAGYQASPTSFNGNGLDEFNGLFSPSIIESVARSNSSDYQFPSNNGLPSFGKQSQSDISSPYNVSNGNRAHSTSITASPSASSMSHGGMDSSCGTTPEPSADMPEHRKPSEGALNTINEESALKNTMEGKKSFCNDWATACGDTTNPVPRMLSESGRGPAPPSSVMKSPATDVNGIDWMAQQNGGQFDPVLFGDYRDSNDSLFNNEFFNEAFLAQDFTTPFNMPESTSPMPPKKDLMQQVEEQQNGGDDEVVPGDQPKQFLTCDKLWDRVQASEKAQSGEVDMDNLCSQLKSKAKCSGKGAVIEQKDVDEILGPAPEEQRDFLKMFK